MKRATTPNTEGLLALMAMDILIPENRLYGTVGCRSTFKNWERKGVSDAHGNLQRLPIYHVPGMGRAIRISELKAFLEAIGKLKDYPAQG